MLNFYLSSLCMCKYITEDMYLVIRIAFHMFHCSPIDNATLRTQHSMTMDPYENDFELSHNTATSHDSVIPQSSKPSTQSVSEGYSLLRTRMDMFEVGLLQNVAFDSQKHVKLYCEYNLRIHLSGQTTLNFTRPGEINLSSLDVPHGKTSKLMTGEGNVSIFLIFPQISICPSRHLSRKSACPKAK